MNANVIRRVSGNDSTQRGGVLAAVLILLATLLTFALIIGGMFWWFWSAIEEFPEDAKPAVVLQTRQPFVDQVDAVIAAGPTKFQVAANLEKADFPNDLLYLALVKDGEFGTDDDETMEIVRRLEWSGHSWAVMNGTGHGTLSTINGDREVLVVKQEIANTDIADHWLALFERPGYEQDNSTTGVQTASE